MQIMMQFYIQIINLSGVVLALSLVAACAPDTGLQADPDERRLTARLALAESAPPLIVPATGQGDRPPDHEARQLERSALRSANRASRLIEPAAAALLSGTGWGRSWITGKGYGALVRGEPADRCPALTAANAPVRAIAIETAIAACRHELQSWMPSSRQGTQPCGCRLIALDNALLVPLEAFAYAPGTHGRLIGLGAEYAGPLIAREVSTGPVPGAGRVVFGDARRSLAEAVLAADGTVSLELLNDGRRFTGRREPIGWARGRQTERLLLRGPDGERIIALIGIEPAVFLRDGPALAAWPRGMAG